MKNLKKNWFTYVFIIYSIITVVDFLLYRFWDIGTNADDFRNIGFWIILLCIWIYLLQENKKPAAAPESTEPTPPADEPATDD